MSTLLQLPRLADPPLLLRAFSNDDAALIQEVSADSYIPLITTVPAQSDRATALAFVDRQRDRLARGDGYPFAIADLASDEALGHVGLWPREQPSGRASIGYWVAARHRGRGIARRALQMVTTWGLTLPGISRLELYIEPWNEPSWRVAEAVGFQREGLLRGWQPVGDERRDTFMYALLG